MGTAPLLDNDGNYNGAIAGVHDITLQRRTEEELRRSEAELRQITDNISDVIFKTDMALNTVYISPSIERLTGDKPENYLRKSPAERHPAETLQRFHHILTEELKKDKDPSVDRNRTIIVEAEHYKADGSIIWLSFNVRFVRNESGEITGLLGVSRDVTRTRQFQEELIRKNTELNNFAHKVSHSLKGPIISIIGFSEIIKDDPALFSKYFSRIIDNGGAMLSFIDKMLKLARSGRTIGDMTEIDLEKLILHQAQSCSKGDVTFNLKIIKPLMNITGDPVGIEQVFQNLLENSFKYRDQDKPSLDVDISSYLSGNKTIISYSDNGSGIDLEKPDVVFDPGYTLSKNKGTGFGLAITRRIIEAHGGKISVKSGGKNKGVSFAIELPYTGKT